eukprot:4813636-Alexandrium_andersonii.AAC.1
MPVRAISRRIAQLRAQSHAGSFRAMQVLHGPKVYSIRKRSCKFMKSQVGSHQFAPCRVVQARCRCLFKHTR